MLFLNSLDFCVSIVGMFGCYVWGWKVFRMEVGWWFCFLDMYVCSVEIVWDFKILIVLLLILVWCNKEVSCIVVSELRFIWSKFWFGFILVLRMVVVKEYSFCLKLFLKMFCWMILDFVCELLYLVISFFWLILFEGSWGKVFMMIMLLGNMNFGS